MNSYLLDIVFNAPIIIVASTSLIVLIIESTRLTRPSASSTVSIVGLILAVIAAFWQLNNSGESFKRMILFGGYADFFNILFCIIAIITIVLSRNYFEHVLYHRGEVYILVLFATLGMMLIAAANDLIVIFLGIELMSVCLYVLVGLFRTRERSNEAALKYFLLGAFATGFLLYGIALVYGATGTTNLSIMRNVFTNVSHNIIFLIGSGFLLVGFSFKVAAVPFHMWAPDVYEGAPTTITGFMSTGAKAAAFAAFITVFIRVCNFFGGNINQLLGLIAAASMVLGNLVALAQSNIKRMLAYSSIAHAGYMLSGIAAGTHDGQIGVMFYLVAYSAINLGAFGIVSFMETKDGQNLSLEDYSGLSKQKPSIAALMAIFMIALSGIPPFAGFFGKYYVFLAAIKSNMTWLAIVGVLTSLISAYYYLRLVVIMYFRDGQADIVSLPSRFSYLTIVLCAIVVFIFGIFPSLIIDVASRFF